MSDPMQNVVRPDVVPGVMHCAKCNFQLTRTNLYVQSGTVGAGGNETEPCPNGCGPLWPVTWKQYAEEAMEATERFFDESQKYKAALETIAKYPATRDDELSAASMRKLARGVLGA